MVKNLLRLSTHVASLFGAIVLLTSCMSQRERFDYGEPLLANHPVSFEALLGDSEWYDGQPISIVGVADFEFGPERASSLYASQSDRRNGTYSRVILEIESDNSALREELIRLNGMFLHVEGIFHHYGKTRLPLPGETKNGRSYFSVCIGICGATGYIEVLRIRHVRH